MRQDKFEKIKSKLQKALNRIGNDWLTIEQYDELKQILRDQQNNLPLPPPRKKQLPDRVNYDVAPKPGPVGYRVLDISMLNGWSHKVPTDSMRKLVRAVDDWIEHHNGLITSISMSPEFSAHFMKENLCGRCNAIETIVGPAKWIVDPLQSKNLVVVR